MSRFSLQRLSQYAVLLLIAFAILWRGGKSLDATWLLAGVAWFTTLAYWNRRKEYPAVPLFLWWALIAFLGWSILSFLLSTTKNYGLDEVLRDTSLTLLFLWIIRIAQTDDGARFARNVIRVIAIAALLACAIGIAVYVLQPVNRFVGTFFDHRFHTDYWPNAWAQFVLIAWPLLLLWISESTGRIRWLLVAALGFLLGGLMLSYSRGGMIAFGGQVALLALLLVLRKEIHRKTLGIFIIAVAAVAGVTFGGANLLRSQIYDVQSVAEKVTFTADEGTSSFSERKAFWRQALTLSLEKPIFGWGPYSFRFIQPRLQRGVLETSDHPHNVFLKLAMERGWMAAILFLLIIGYIAFYSAKKFIVSSFWFLIEPEPIKVAIYFIAIVGVLAHNLIDYNLQFISIAIPFWLILGLLATSFVKLQPTTYKLPTSQKFTELALAILLFIVTLIEGSYLVITSVGRHWQAVGRRDDAVLIYRSARYESFSRDMHLSHALALMQGNRFHEALVALNWYRAQNQEDARGWKMEGDIRTKLFDYESAYYAYTEAYERSKWNDLGVMRGYSESLVQTRMQDELLFRLKEIRQILQAFADATERNTHFVALSGNVEEFAAVTSLLSRLYPGDASWYLALNSRVQEAAKSERAKILARPPGFIW